MDLSRVCRFDLLRLGGHRWGLRGGHSSSTRVDTAFILPSTAVTRSSRRSQQSAPSKALVFRIGDKEFSRSMYDGEGSSVPEFAIANR